LAAHTLIAQLHANLVDIPFHLFDPPLTEPNPLPTLLQRRRQIVQQPHQDRPRIRRAPDRRTLRLVQITSRLHQRRLQMQPTLVETIHNDRKPLLMDPAQEMPRKIHTLHLQIHPPRHQDEHQAQP
jgi:hypothetical protein